MVVQSYCIILQITKINHAGTREETDMDLTNSGQSEREVQQAHANREELVERLSRAIRTDGSVEPLPGLMLHRVSAPTEMGHVLSYLSFCVIPQGSKEVFLGNNRYQYDPAHYLIATATLPIATRVIEASPEHPYLGLVLNLDPILVSSVLAEASYIPQQRHSAVPAIDVSPLDASLLDAVLRLVRLLDAPSQARFLAPLITREIVYRLLIGAQGGRLRQVAAPGSATQRITEAIEWLRNNLDQPLRIDAIARELGMSVSGFHHHFRVLTAMSPLQFQKQLRLQEARRLMLAERLDAASTGYRVGYNDAAHFSREYKRLFGEPPIRDVERLRDAVMVAG